MGLVRIGVDIGQLRDPTAVVAVEEVAADDVTLFIARHIESVPLGTSYPAVAVRIAEVARRLLDTRDEDLWAVVDVTGVGRPVFDLVFDAIGERSRLSLSACTFVASDRLEGGFGSPEIRLGKAWLVSRLQALLQTRSIRLPETPEARRLAQELTDYELRLTERGSLTAGAFGTRHDDLATALGLAVLDAPRQIPAVAPVGLRRTSPWDMGASHGTPGDYAAAGHDALGWERRAY
jgi:hypothetical protein